MITFKKIHISTAIILCLFCIPGCAIYESNYFGDHEQPTTHIEIYQDSKDIKQPFKVIGHFIAEIPNDEKGQKKVRLQLIEKAKKVGANGLIFSDLNLKSRFKNTIYDYTIKADAIKFVSIPDR